MALFESSSSCKLQAHKEYCFDWKGSLMNLAVKNTFIHIDDAADEERKATQERVLSRSASSPAMLESRAFSVVEKLIEDDRESTDEEASTVGSTEASTANSTSSEEKLVAHRQGICKPCGYYFFKEDGCRLGDSCEFCHLCTIDEVKNRKRNSKREARAMKRASGYTTAKFQSRPGTAQFLLHGHPMWHRPGPLPASVH